MSFLNYMYLLNEIKNCNVTAHNVKGLWSHCIAKVYIFQEKMYSCDFKNHFQWKHLYQKLVLMAYKAF